MAAIPENHRAKDMKRLDLDPGQLPVERVLCVVWLGCRIFVDRYLSVDHCDYFDFEFVHFIMS